MTKFKSSIITSPSAPILPSCNFTTPKHLVFSPSHRHNDGTPGAERKKITRTNFPSSLGRCHTHTHCRIKTHKGNAASAE